MLQPVRTKWRKAHKGRIHGTATRASTINYGAFALKALQPERITGKHFWLSMVAFFFVGLYGGFIQAGVGFIILVLLSSINQFSLVKSNAVKVSVVLIYSLAAVAVFAYNESINWKYGLILSIGNAAGGWVMSRWSVDKGDKFVKKVLIIMVLAMAIKLWFPDFYSILASQILDLF